MNIVSSSDPNPQGKKEIRLPGANRFRLAGGRRQLRSNRYYTHFVILSKWMLPITAFGILLTVVIWPQIEAPEGFSITPVNADLINSTQQSIINPQFRGLDGEQKPYRIRSSAAFQSTTIKDGVEMDQPEAELRFHDGAQLLLTAESGLFHRQDNKLELFGGVTLLHQGRDTHQIGVDMAEVDLNNQSAYSSAPIQAKGPVGMVEAAGGFQIGKGGTRIIFTGPTRLILNQDAKLPITAR